MTYLNNLFVELHQKKFICPVRIGTSFFTQIPTLSLTLKIEQRALKAECPYLPSFHPFSLEEIIEDFSHDFTSFLLNPIYTPPPFSTSCAYFSFDMLWHQYHLNWVLSSIPVYAENHNYLLFSPYNISSIKNFSSFKRFKIKISPSSSLEEIEKIKFFIKNLLPHQKLRLDGNKLFSWKLFLEFWNYFSKEECLKIEYVESPLMNITDWEKILNHFSDFNSFNLVLASEEEKDFFRNNPEKIVSYNLKTIVIKYSTLKGVEELKVWQKFCQTHSLNLILSSSFEFSEGLSFQQQMLNFLKFPSDQIHGLGTSHYLH